MLALRETGTLPPAPGLDAGTLAVRIARSWACAGHDVLAVDADAHGSGLAERIGAATRTTLAPARRGLPTLIAARELLSAGNLTRHCWRLAGRGPGTVWLLAAPTHPKGAAKSAAWLAERSEEFAALATGMSVVLAMPGSPTDAYERLRDAATHCIALSGGPGPAPPGGMRAVLSAFGFRFNPDPVTLLLATNDDSGPAESEASVVDEAVLGRFGPVRPTALLGGRARQRDRLALAAIDVFAGRLCEAPESCAEPRTGGGRSNGSAGALGSSSDDRMQAHMQTARSAGVSR
ncbi:CpsD/CapB family tyrosine-protein kinase [Candidatus Poribacteria bacterium]|nr:CpsD/CapB family tyrosine-protein kinase [Candidatus Poribacteria bacterium]